MINLTRSILDIRIKPFTTSAHPGCLIFYVIEKYDIGFHRHLLALYL